MRTTRLRRFGMVAAGLLVAASVSGIAGSSPAQAATSDCVGGRNGFIDIPDSLRGTDAVPPVDFGDGVKVHLYYGNVRGAQRGWAMIDGPTRPGETVFFRFSRDGGNTIAIWCGDFEVSANNQTLTSPALVTSSSPSYRFQACGRARGAIGCTTWW